MNKESVITIGITGLNNTDNPGPGIPVIRGIRESKDLNVRIIGLAYENLEPGIYMPGMVDKTYQIPYPSSGRDQVFDRIKAIHEKENFDIIIPNFDAELTTFRLMEEDLKEMGISMIIPTEKQFDERHKHNLIEFGKKYDIQVPKTVTLTSPNDIETLKDHLDFPVFVKGKFYDAYMAVDENQVLSHFKNIAAKWGLPVIVQQCVKGTEVNVVALGDGKGNTIGAVPMRKQYITDKGKAWGGIAIKDNKLLEICNRIIRATSWRGGMELEMIKTANGEYYLIEINPRLPAWVYLAVGAGQNIPEAMVKMALGYDVPPFSSYKAGTMFIRYSYDLIGDIHDFEKLSLFGEL